MRETPVIRSYLSHDTLKGAPLTQACRETVDSLHLCVYTSHGVMTNRAHSTDGAESAGTTDEQVVLVELQDHFVVVLTVVQCLSQSDTRVQARRFYLEVEVVMEICQGCLKQ